MPSFVSSVFRKSDFGRAFVNLAHPTLAHFKVLFDETPGTRASGLDFPESRLSAKRLGRLPVTW